MRELASLWIHRRVVTSLARHDLRSAYAGTAGGLAWAVLTPLIPLVIFTAVFSLGLRLPLGGAPYVFGFAAAYVPWVLLSTSISGAAASILDHRYLVKRVRFPVEVIFAAPVVVQTVSHAILLAITAVACGIAGYLRFPAVLLLPYFYVCAAVLIAGVGLFLGSLSVLIRDVPHVLPSFLNVWFWVTPVAWSAAQLPARGRELLALNPAAYVVTGYRHALMPSAFAGPTGAQTAMFWASVLLILTIAGLSFRRLRTHFWDCL